MVRQWMIRVTSVAATTLPAPRVRERNQVPRMSETAGEAMTPFFDLRFLCAGVIGGFSNLAEAALDSAGLSLLEWGVLERCAKGQADTVTALTKCIPVDQASISRAADQLVRLGHLGRRRLQRDRRVVRLNATQQGQALTRWMESQLQAIYAVLLEGISEEDAQTFAHVARKISANANDRRSRNRHGKEESDLGAASQ